MNVKFRIAAIKSQIKYGICMYPATLFFVMNSLIIMITNNINKSIHINANVNNLNLKKMNDQSKLIISCVIYIFDISFVFLYTRYDDIPINVYRIVHTTGNIHGGIILSILEFGVVIRPTIAPNTRGIKIKIDNFL